MPQLLNGLSKLTNGLVNRQSSPIFNPATLPLSLWIKPSFAGMPWVGTASTGVSGSHNLITQSDDPTAGTAVNGKVPALFNGSSNFIATDANSTTFLGAHGSVWYLFKATSAPADPGTNYGRGNILTDPVNAELTFGFTSLGITGTIYAGAYKENYVACSANAWHLAQWRYDGSNLSGRVDGGSWVDVPCGNYTSITPSAFRIGTSYTNLVRFTGSILEIATSTSALSNADFNNVLSYARSTYGLALT